MSQHQRLGEASPARGLDDRILRLLLQFSGLETPSANSEQDCPSVDQDGAPAGGDALMSMDDTPSDDTYDDLSLEDSDVSRDWTTDVRLLLDPSDSAMLCLN